jgi:hypothetical protein
MLGSAGPDRRGQIGGAMPAQKQTAGTFPAVYRLDYHAKNPRGMVRAMPRVPRFSNSVAGIGTCIFWSVQSRWN